MKWISYLFRRDRLERDLDRELAYHLDRRTQELEAGGLLRREARRQAFIEFGGLAQTKEDVRGTWFARWPQDLLQDIIYGCRILGRSPGFTAAAILSLALGIGANTAVFSLINAVLLRMMPVERPDRLVQVVKQQSGGPGSFSYYVFEQLRERVPSFEGASAIAFAGRREVLLGKEPEEAMAELVSVNHYSVLGLQPALGRLFTAADRDAPVAVISHSYWRRRFGLDPGVVGRTFRLNNRMFTILGVAPRGFFGVVPGQAPDFTFPLHLDGVVRGGQSWVNNRNFNFVQVMARLRPGDCRKGIPSWGYAHFAEGCRRQPGFRPLFLQRRLTSRPQAASRHQ